VADTEIEGEWQAVGASDAVTIALVGNTASSITGTANAVLTGGADGKITQKAGTLTIAAATEINLATAGSIVLAKKPDSSTAGGTLNLSATSAKISGLIGGGTDRTLTTSNIANATYTSGSSVGDLAGGGTANAGNAYITGGATGSNPITASGTANDVTIDKTTTIGS
jgi:hypothetical protein